MARKRKERAGTDSAPENEKPKPAPKIATGLGALLKEAGVKPASPRSGTISKGRGPHTLPPPMPEAPARIIQPVPKPALDVETKLTATELRELNDAYAGVRKLSQKTMKSMPYREVVPQTQHAERRAQAKQDEAAARARLAALVGGGVRFKVKRDDDFVEGLRQGASSKLLARVTGRGFASEATLDLHGKREVEVAPLVTEFVRKHHRQGARQLLVITGKGLHSDGGVAVLRDAAIEALSSGGGAPLIVAFATAHADHGGSGAIAVLLDA